MRGAGVVDRTLFKPNPNPQNISEQQWDLLNALEERVKETGVGGEVMFPFKGVVNSLCSKYDAWVKWIASDSLFTDPLPDKEVSERSERALMEDEHTSIRTTTKLTHPNSPRTFSFFARRRTRSFAKLFFALRSSSSSLRCRGTRRRRTFPTLCIRRFRRTT